MGEKTTVGALVHALVNGTTYQMLDAAEEIGRRGEGAVLAIAPLLRSVHRETRWRAAVAMERIGPPSVEALMIAAGDRDWRVRIPAIWALEHIGDERSIPSLIQNLLGSNECCRWMAAAALNRIGDDDIRQTVEEVFVADPFGRGVIEELIEGS
ncbi:MAG: HEAT repeat domain-containing protein [Methanospirillum sp.]